MFPVEIYFEIFRHIRDPRRSSSSAWRVETNTLLSLSTSSTTVGPIAKVFLYETVDFTGNWGTFGTSMTLFDRTVNASPALGPLVKTIRLDIPPTWQLHGIIIASTMRHLTNLRKLLHMSFVPTDQGLPEWTLICAPHLEELITNCEFDSEPGLMSKFIQRAKNLRVFLDIFVNRWPSEMDFPCLTALEIAYSLRTFPTHGHLNSIQHLSLFLEERFGIDDRVRLPHIPQLVRLRIELTIFNDAILPNVFASMSSISENNGNIEFFWVEVTVKEDNMENPPLALPGNWEKLKTLIWAVRSNPKLLESFSANMPQLQKLIGHATPHWVEYNTLPDGTVESKLYPETDQIYRECWRSECSQIILPPDDS